MVQRKEVIKTEKSFATSHHSHQETRNKGGGEVKKKKIMSLQCDDAFKKSLPNYMKPTTCSGARKVTPVNLQSKTSCSGSKPAKNLVRKSSLKHVRVGSSVVCNPRKSVKRATCSSTQKDSKFPKALDLNPGGTSVVRLCPYSYCSLNGHRHEVLPPLKSFIESRRLALKIEQRLKLKKEEKIDAGKKKVVKKNQPLVEELGVDFFVQIFAKELVSCDQIEVVFDDNGSDCGSESSICEMDGLMSLVEYVEFDQVEKDVEENELKCVVSEQRGLEDAADSNDAFMASEIVAVSHDVCEDVADYDIFVSEQRGIEDAASSNDAFIASKIVSVSHDVCEYAPDEEAFDDEEEENLGGDSSEVQSNKLIVEEEVVPKDTVEKLAVESELISVTLEQLSETDKSTTTTTTTTDSDQECSEASDDETDGDEEVRKISNNRARVGARSLTVSLCDNPKLRMRITRKERPEEEEMIKREFNPRSPNFLPCQPEPDNEKVDLKHQEMNDRKNAEEWMLDYALRQAVTKLSPASKRRVALLVKAFETVIPMRIQACS